MKLNKTMLIIAMVVILIGLGYSLTQRLLLGLLLCLGATTGLFILANHRGAR